MIKIYYRATNSELNELAEFKAGCWIDVLAPSPEELEKLSSLLKVEKDLLQDALDPFEVPRLELENDITYVFTRVPEMRGAEIVTVPFLLVLGESFVLTIASSQFAFLENIRNGKKNFCTISQTKLFMQIFSGVNATYNNLLIGINKRLRGIRIRLEKIDSKDIVQFIDFEGVLNDFLSALIPTNASLAKLLDGKHIKLYEEDKDLVEDLLLSNGQLIETSKATLKYVVNIRSAYSNIMTHDLNRVMKILTALTIILTIPTMIFSFFGMNVNLPFSSYPGIAFFTIFILFFIFILFIKKRWL